MAPGLLQRIFSPLAQAQALTTWPPSDEIRKRWERAAGYRRRFNNDKAEMLQYAHEWNGSTYGAQIYTPIAVGRETCLFSADMLFSAPPTWSYDDDADLLQTILAANGLAARLVAMGGMVAAEGRGGLRIIRDPQIADRTPLITHVSEDQVIWDERHGGFVTGGVVIAERYPQIGWAGAAGTVFRLVEEHTPGRVRRQLFRGTESRLGSIVPLNTLKEFEALAADELTGLDVPTLIRWDNVPGGYSDMAGSEAVLDQINSEVTRGVEKSDKSRPVSFADSTLFDGNGLAALEGIVPIRRGRLQSLEQDPTKLFGTIQPDFTADATIAWVDFLIDTALLTMGYSKASYGRDQGGSADSGKALSLRQARTYLKKAGKDRMATEAIVNALAIAMAWQDNDGTEAKVANYRPDMKLGDGLPRDALELAQEANTWGDSISLHEKIRLRRPDWTDEDIDKEIERIDSRAPARAPAVPQLPTLNGALANLTRAKPASAGNQGDA